MGTAEINISAYFNIENIQGKDLHKLDEAITWAIRRGFGEDNVELNGSGTFLGDPPQRDISFTVHMNVD